MAQDTGRLADLAQDEHDIRLPADILAGLGLEIAIQAGQGVALARAVLVQDDLMAGRLVRRFDVKAADEYRWFLVWREPLRCDRQAFLAYRRGWAVDGAIGRLAGRPGYSRPPFASWISHCLNRRTAGFRSRSGLVTA